MPTKIVKVGNIDCGSPELFIIAGPCVIETEAIMYKTAEYLKLFSIQHNIPVIYKSSFLKDNRSNLSFYQGPPLQEGLKILQNIRHQFHLPVLTDVHYPEHVKEVADIVDVLQIPAYLVMQTSLVVEAAKTGLPINLKHAQFLSPDNMIKPIQKALDSGNDKILVTERGYTFGYNDLIVDPRSFYHLRQTGFPVVFDITHSIRRYGIPSSDERGGMRQYLHTIARAGVAAGVDGIFIETHPDPANALCDAATQLCIDEFESFVLQLVEFHNLEVRFRN